nr:hypothetical protein [Verrucomicrobiota bacterium JB025]
MYKRLRYLLSEGFAVENVAGYDTPTGSDKPGRGTITYIRPMPHGVRRLVTEEFSVTGLEVKRCTALFLRTSMG